MDIPLFTDPMIWQKVFYLIGSFAALRVLIMAGRFSRFMDDIDYRDVERFKRENQKRLGG